MNSPILEANGISKHFSVKSGAFGPKKVLRAVEGVDLRLHSGETLGLAGESGCGKSTVARLIMGLVPVTAGSVSYLGRSLEGMGRDDKSAFRKDVQMIFQDPFSSLNPRMRVGDIIGEPLAIHGLATGIEKRRIVLDLMDKVGLAKEHFSRYPHEFSGGQRQRIGIARALAVSPKVIIADEPVSALDLSIQAQIINLLQELKRDFSLSFLFIAHDLSVVRHMSDRVAIMYMGRIVEAGGREEVFGRLLHPYTEGLLSAVPRIRAEERKNRIVLQGDIPSPIDPPSGCPFHTRCPYVERPICTESRPLLEEKEPGHFAACHLSAKLFR